MSKAAITRWRYPLLPLKNVVVLPRNIVTLLVGRARSIQAIEDALAHDHYLVVTAQRDAQHDEPTPEHLYSVGTLTRIAQVERQPGGNVQVVLEGAGRVRLEEIQREERLYTTHAIALEETGSGVPATAILVQHIKELVSRYAESKNRLSAEAVDLAGRTDDGGQLADLLITQLVADLAERQRLLEMADIKARLEAVAVHLSNELDVATLEQKIKERVREQI